jgi:hypothetical protein
MASLRRLPGAGHFLWPSDGPSPPDPVQAPNFAPGNPRNETCVSVVKGKRTNVGRLYEG